MKKLLVVCILFITCTGCVVVEKNPPATNLTVRTEYRPAKPEEMKMVAEFSLTR